MSTPEMKNGENNETLSEEDIRRQNRVLRSSLEQKKELLSDLRMKLNSIVQESECREEHFTNAMLRKLQKARNEKELLAAHLRGEESRREIQKEKYRKLTRDRHKLDEKLKREEDHIKGCLTTQIKTIQNKRHELERKLDTESMSLKQLQDVIYSHLHNSNVPTSQQFILPTVSGSFTSPSTAERSLPPTGIHRWNSGSFSGVHTDAMAAMDSIESVNSIDTSVVDNLVSIQAQRHNSNATTHTVATTCSGRSNSTLSPMQDGVMVHQLKQEIQRARALQKETQKRIVECQRKREEMEESLFNWMDKRRQERGVGSLIDFMNINRCGPIHVDSEPRSSSHMMRLECASNDSSSMLQHDMSYDATRCYRGTGTDVSRPSTMCTPRDMRSLRGRSIGANDDPLNYTGDARQQCGSSTPFRPSFIVTDTKSGSGVCTGDFSFQQQSQAPCSVLLSNSGNDANALMISPINIGTSQTVGVGNYFSERDLSGKLIPNSNVFTPSPISENKDNTDSFSLSTTRSQGGQFAAQNPYRSSYGHVSSIASRLKTETNSVSNTPNTPSLHGSVGAQGQTHQTRQLAQQHCNVTPHGFTRESSLARIRSSSVTQGGHALMGQGSSSRKDCESKDVIRLNAAALHMLRMAQQGGSRGSGTGIPYVGGMDQFTTALSETSGHQGTHSV
eukprot:Tbor_TRINITY_DN5331_c2_g9::TRINITY_DN5331_c2_g9_i1::g.4745::m.4745